MATTKSMKRSRLVETDAPETDAPVAKHPRTTGEFTDPATPVDERKAVDEREVDAPVATVDDECKVDAPVATVDEREVDAPVAMVDDECRKTADDEMAERCALFLEALRSLGTTKLIAAYEALRDIDLDLDDPYRFITGLNRDKDSNEQSVILDLLHRMIDVQSQVGWNDPTTPAFCRAVGVFGTTSFINRFNFETLGGEDWVDDNEALVDTMNSVIEAARSFRIVLCDRCVICVADVGPGHDDLQKWVSFPDEDEEPAFLCPVCARKRRDTTGLE